MTSAQNSAFDDSTTNWSLISSQFQKQGVDLKLAHSREWRRLIHVEQSGEGRPHRSFHAQNFYLSKNTLITAQSELQATLESFLNQNLKIRGASQCRYLARRNFLQQRLPEIKTYFEICEERQAWHQSLGVTGISLIFAAADLNSAATSFGHSFLKINSQKSQEGLSLVDYGINYSAETSTPTLLPTSVAGLVGIFPGFYSFLPYHQKLAEYSRIEGRDLWEFELNLTAQEVIQILDHLWELEGVTSEYFYLDENCSYKILELLEIGRPHLKLLEKQKFFVIPRDSIKVVLEEANLVKTTKYRPSLKTQYAFYRNRLKNKERHCADRLRSNRVCQNATSEILDVAILGVQLESPTNPKTLIQLASLRAQAGGSRQQLEIPVPIGIERAHGSSKIEAVGFENRTQFNLLPAFHSWLSQDHAIARGSELKLFELQMNLEDQKIQFEKIDLVRILSLGDWNLQTSEFSYLLEASLLAKNFDSNFAIGVGFSTRSEEVNLIFYLVPEIYLSSREFRKLAGGGFEMGAQWRQANLFILSQKLRYQKDLIDRTEGREAVDVDVSLGFVLTKDWQIIVAKTWRKDFLAAETSNQFGIGTSFYF